MKEIVTNIMLFISNRKAVERKLLLRAMSCASLFLLTHHVKAQIVYQDISPDLAGAAITDTVLGQIFQWSMLNGNQPAFSAASTDSLIMVTPGQGNMMLRLSGGDTVKPASSWHTNAWNGPAAAVAAVNKYLGFRVGTPGNYRYGWFKIDVNSATPQWNVKSYAYEQTLNKYIIAGDVGNNGTGGGDSDDIYLTCVTINAQGSSGGTFTITTNGGTLQMTFTASPANASHPEILWFVQNVTGAASISETGLLTAQANGTVMVIAMAQDGSGVSDTVTVTISGQVTVGIADVNKLAGLFYPNPAKEKVTVQFGTEERIHSITIRNVAGQVVYADERTSTGKQISIPVDFLPEGLYILTYQNVAGQQGLHKFMKTR